MTTIAYDGKSMSADTQATSVNRAFEVQKVFKLDDGSVVGFAGHLSSNMLLLNWFKTGMLAEEYPEACKDVEAPKTVALHVTIDGKICQYEASPYPHEILGKFAAIGTGEDFAIAAMHCGKDSRGALEIAGTYDINTNTTIRTEYPDFLGTPF
jgi:ATP-dependent protease HslVU (ClpYQ) peptidase subunit